MGMAYTNSHHSAHNGQLRIGRCMASFSWIVRVLILSILAIIYSLNMLEHDKFLRYISNFHR